MKNKKMNKILATTMITTMLAMPFASTAHAMETMNSSYQYEETNEFTLNPNDDDEKLKVGEEITFTDLEIYQAAKDMGYDVDMSIVGSRASNGVNKIVRTKTGYNIYVSKNTLLLASTVGATALGWVISAVSAGAGTLIVGLIVQHANNTITSGKVFRFDKIKVGKYNYKYALIKVWNQ